MQLGGNGRKDRTAGREEKEQWEEEGREGRLSGKRREGGENN